MSIARRREDTRIERENVALANRMLRLPPVISNKAMEKEF